MIKLTLEIDNKIACSMSPVEFVERYVLSSELVREFDRPGNVTREYDGKLLKVKIKSIKQV